MALNQGLSPYREGKETYRSLAKTIVKKRKGPKQSIKKYKKTIYYNIIPARLILKRYIGVKGIEANKGKRNLSYSIVNAIGDKDLRALKRPNKGRKHNNNTPKDRNNRTKRLALLGRCPSQGCKYTV